MTTARVVCRMCSKEISAADVNVAEGVAFCRVCGSLSKLADIVADAELPEANALPPDGCSIVDDGLQTIVRATGRSLSASIGLVAMTVFWNSGVILFVLVALAQTLTHIFGSVPPWFPTPFGSSPFASNGPVSIGMLIFLWIFLTPFVCIGMLLLGSLAVTLFGRVEVRFREDDGTVFIGCGSIGWSRQFRLSDVKTVALGQTTWRQNDQTQPVVVIDCGRKIRFGSTLPEERREWMAAVLRKLLVP